MLLRAIGMFATWAQLNPGHDRSECLGVPSLTLLLVGQPLLRAQIIRPMYELQTLSNHFLCFSDKYFLTVFVLHPGNTPTGY